ncbi:hypothetical protein PGIGA_G00236410 [Pangasianodon gigas]|uniref:Uncharacterized protein n=1 Tax=Pangasianodon gigas TaxID=30993 RepID=A0ACC5WN81_PANGG|nr:hypothetical protein [Pangasianodon gigas]
MLEDVELRAHAHSERRGGARILACLWVVGTLRDDRLQKAICCSRLSSGLTCLTTDVLNRICGPSMRNYRLIFCHNLKQP